MRVRFERTTWDGRRCAGIFLVVAKSHAIVKYRQTTMYQGDSRNTNIKNPTVVFRRELGPMPVMCHSPMKATSRTSLRNWVRRHLCTICCSHGRRSESKPKLPANPAHLNVEGDGTNQRTQSSAWSCVFAPLQACLPSPPATAQSSRKDSCRKRDANRFHRSVLFRCSPSGPPPLALLHSW